MAACTKTAHTRTPCTTQQELNIRFKGTHTPIPPHLGLAHCSARSAKAYASAAGQLPARGSMTEGKCSRWGSERTARSTLLTREVDASPVSSCSSTIPAGVCAGAQCDGGY